MNETRLNEPKLLADHPVSLLKCTDEKLAEHFLTSKFTFIEEIQARAETMTPCLKGILEFRPHPSWRL